VKDERLRALEILDAEEGTGPVPILIGDEPARLLAKSHRIALIGASPNAARPSNGVMQFLLEQGYDVVPIRPARTEILGQKVYATLEEATEETGKFDLVDVFRRAEFTPDIARSVVSTRAGSLWLQLGIVNWEAAGIAHDAGIPVVMDRCTRVEYRRISSFDSDQR